MSLLCQDRFYLGNVPTFLQIVRILKSDPEFCLAFDFGCKRLDIESMLLSGVVGIGVRLVQGDTAGILVPSPLTRSDRVTLRVDSSALYQAVSALNQVTYAYMSLGLVKDENAIYLCTYAPDHTSLGTATVHTLDLEEHDMDFRIMGPQLEALDYPLCMEQLGQTWKAYLQSATIDTVIHYRPAARSVTWETSNQQTRMELFMAVTTTCTQEVRICLLPSVVAILQTILTMAAKYPTQLALSTPLPLRARVQLDAHGSFLQVYAGTKDDQ